MITAVLLQKKKTDLRVAVTENTGNNTKLNGSKEHIVRPVQNWFSMVTIPLQFFVRVCPHQNISLQYTAAKTNTCSTKSRRQVVILHFEFSHLNTYSTLNDMHGG